MTARRQIPNYESRLREYTNFAVRGIKKVCKACGPRPPASEAERESQEMMRKELETCCDSVAMESFRVAPRAFMSWVRTGVVLAALSALAYNLGYAIASAALMAFELVFILLEFILYKQAADVFLPKKESQNLIGVRRPAGELKRRLILCGHADSANEWTYTYLGDKLFKSTKLLMACVFSALIAMVSGLGISIAALAQGHGWGGLAALQERGQFLNTLGYIYAGLCLPVLSGLFFENKKRPVEGANDNLTGCFTAMAAAKLLGDLDLRLENTELVVLCSGSEEIGLRGAKAFVKAHAKEYKDAETVFIALDTMTELEYIGIYLDDLTMTVKHDPAVCAMIRTAANTAGHDVPYQHLILGGSDAAAATQGGLHAAALAAMNPSPAAYYHTRLDTTEKLQPKSLEACLDIVLETAYQFDETGLAPFEGSKVAVIK